MSTFSNTLASFFGEGLWGVICAILLLILGLIVASIVKSLVNKLLTRAKLKSWLDKNDTGNYERIAEFIGKLAYLVTFLLFVPGIFEHLGMTQVSEPITGVLDTLWGYLPNLLAAAVVLWAGFFIARLVRELLIPVFNKLKVNRLQEKAGIQVEDSAKLSNTLAYIVYVIILIPVIIAALQVLNIEAISQPAMKMLNMIFSYIPNIIAALIIIILGMMVAKLAKNIVMSLIASSGLDEKLSQHLDGKAGKFVLSKVVGNVIYVVLAFFFIVESLGVLHLEVLTNIGDGIIGYLPNVLAAVLILLACYVCDSLVQKALKKDHANIAVVCRVGIYGIGAFMILSELGIAAELVNAAFILIVAAVAVAFAVSFGIGGKDFASRSLNRLDEKMEELKQEKEDAGEKQDQ